MKILVRNESGVRALEEGYASEEELQVFLREHAELIPVDEIEIGTLPLFCIGFEVGVSSGSQDLLYLDSAGLLTVVETKLKKNPEARREVVGQVLEYGAQMCTWSSADVERKANQFLASDICPQEYRGKPLDEAMTLFLEKHGGPDLADFSYEAFLEAITANLERGHIRLIIAIDEPPEPLFRTVEFVNRYSQHFEMYLLQLKRFRDMAASQDIFVPSIFGRVAGPKTGRPGPGIEWNADTFSAQASQRASPSAVRVLEHLHEFAESQNSIVWGRGRSVASFRFQIKFADGRRTDLFYGYGNGKVEILFSGLQQFATQDVIDRYRAQLRQVGPIPEDVVTTTTWKRFDASLLDREDALARFEDAIRKITAALKGGEEHGGAQD